MLTKEENDLLTRTGPGTPCGDFMRRYWQPVALAEELEPDGPPVAARLLGEDLVVYRDLQGRLGVLGRWCSHRGTDLRYGSVEEAGLRCGYHGWLYNHAGRCLEQPLEPPDSTLKDEIQHKAYPCQEHAGIIFAYLGPGEPPLMPSYEFFQVPESQRRCTKYVQECNYLQGAEGSVDPVQLIALRRILSRTQSTELADEHLEDEVAVEPEETEFGIRLVSSWQESPAAISHEVRSFMLPSLCCVPGVGIDGFSVHWHVPMDDTHHWRFVIAFRRDGDLSDEDARRNGVERTNDYRVDHSAIAQYLHEQNESMPEPNIIAWTTMLAESQGAIYDRTQENLAGSDRGIVAMRSVVYGAIQDVREGADPPHVVRDPAANRFPGIDAREHAIPAGDDGQPVGA
ncbi:MAG TPA: Rieske 2Fe-2S domain-containing protein [Chloroflexota bacterium]|nr:Rieske 2Fe-2S domain-containing protein [Chloroflexota bacterium]